LFYESDWFTDGLLLRFEFTDAVAAFNTTKTGKGPDGKGVIKAIINGPK
jgi:phosphoribosylaminoimidazole-succinocarboxamide synthase